MGRNVRYLFVAGWVGGGSVVIDLRTYWSCVRPGHLEMLVVLEILSLSELDSGFYGDKVWAWYHGVGVRDVIPHCKIWGKSGWMYRQVRLHLAGGSRQETGGDHSPSSLGGAHSGSDSFQGSHVPVFMCCHLHPCWLPTLYWSLCTHTTIIISLISFADCRLLLSHPCQQASFTFTNVLLYWWLKLSHRTVILMYTVATVWYRQTAVHLSTTKLAVSEDSSNGSSAC